jgi:hypothetical protein
MIIKVVHQAETRLQLMLASSPLRDLPPDHEAEHCIIEPNATVIMIAAEPQ